MAERLGAAIAATFLESKPRTVPMAKPVEPAVALEQAA